jgi:uncharacterized protein (TIGR02217 family)
MGILAGRYPDVIAAGAEGGRAHFKTTIVPHEGGQETPHLDWTDLRGEWNVSRAIEESGEHELARRHFIKARGSFHHFRFKDHADFECTRTGDDLGRLTGSTTAWQINKVYGADEPTFEYVCPLKRIVDGSVQVWKDSVLQTPTTHYTVDNDTGIITSTSSWAGTTLEVACEFDILCRYDTQRLSARLVHLYANGAKLMEWPDIDIVEVRES